MCNKILGIMLLGVMFAASFAVAQDVKIQEAKDFFENFVSLSQKFNPKVADLYSDNALIKNIRHYPFGQVREMTMPAKEYKAMIRKTMSFARMRGDISTFSDISYSEEGDKVRITATRYSKLKRYNSPYSLLIGLDANNNWIIFEEITESRP